MSRYYPQEEPQPPVRYSNWTQLPVWDSNWTQPPVRHSNWTRLPVWDSNWTQPPVRHSNWTQPPVRHSNYSFSQIMILIIIVIVYNHRCHGKRHAVGWLTMCPRWIVLVWSFFFRWQSLTSDKIQLQRTRNNYSLIKQGISLHSRYINSAMYNQYADIQVLQIIIQDKLLNCSC